MPGNADGTGTVSWRVFNDLYESQYDLFRKLCFFIKAGRSDKNEKLALDMIESLLTGKQEELEALRQKALEEWKSTGQTSKELALRSGVPPMEQTQEGVDGPLLLPDEAQRRRITLWNWLKASKRSGK